MASKSVFVDAADRLRLKSNLCLGTWFRATERFVQSLPGWTSSLQSGYPSITGVLRPNPSHRHKDTKWQCHLVSISKLKFNSEKPILYYIFGGVIQVDCRRSGMGGHNIIYRVDVVQDNWHSGIIVDKCVNFFKNVCPWITVVVSIEFCRRIWRHPPVHCNVANVGKNQKCLVTFTLSLAIRIRVRESVSPCQNNNIDTQSRMFCGGSPILPPFALINAGTSQQECLDGPRPLPDLW